jgi:hypothetical protein
LSEGIQVIPKEKELFAWGQLLASRIYRARDYTRWGSGRRKRKRRRRELISSNNSFLPTLQIVQRRLSAAATLSLSTAHLSLSMMRI